jgi:hypothetical protein
MYQIGGSESHGSEPMNNRIISFHIKFSLNQTNTGW